MNGNEFSPTILHSLIVFILSEMDRSPGAIEFAKIVYLIDVEKASLTGKTMTGESYTRQSKGPLARNFDSCIKDMDGYEISVSVAASGGASQYPKRAHAQGDNPRFGPSLDAIDRIIARRVLARISNLSPLEIERLAYETEPMKAILEQDARAGTRLPGAEIDFSLVELNPIIQKWRENMKKPVEVDARFDAFLRQEAQEIDQILASLV